jgi:hypothetical protein
VVEIAGWALGSVEDYVARARAAGRTGEGVIGRPYSTPAVAGSGPKAEVSIPRQGQDGIASSACGSQCENARLRSLGTRRDGLDRRTVEDGQCCNVLKYINALSPDTVGRVGIGRGVFGNAMALARHLDRRPTPKSSTPIPFGWGPLWGNRFKSLISEHGYLSYLTHA